MESGHHSPCCWHRLWPLRGPWCSPDHRWHMPSGAAGPCYGRSWGPASAFVQMLQRGCCHLRHVPAAQVADCCLHSLRYRSWMREATWLLENWNLLWNRLNCKPRYLSQSQPWHFIRRSCMSSTCHMCAWIRVCWNENIAWWCCHYNVS